MNSVADQSSNRKLDEAIRGVEVAHHRGAQGLPFSGLARADQTSPARPTMRWKSRSCPPSRLENCSDPKRVRTA